MITGIGGILSIPVLGGVRSYAVPAIITSGVLMKSKEIWSPPSNYLTFNSGEQPVVNGNTLTVSCVTIFGDKIAASWPMLSSTTIIGVVRKGDEMRLIHRVGNVIDWYGAPAKTDPGKFVEFRRTR